MTTIEEKRTEAVSKLAELGKIKKPVYSARDLHQKRTMLSRVQRQEQRKFMKQVTTQKIKLKKDITDIDRYLQSVSDYNAYLANGGDFTIFSYPAPVAPTVLPTPNIVFGSRPVLRKTRLARHKRRGKY